MFNEIKHVAQNFLIAKAAYRYSQAHRVYAPALERQFSTVEEAWEAVRQISRALNHGWTWYEHLDNADTQPPLWRNHPLESIWARMIYAGDFFTVLQWKRVDRGEITADQVRSTSFLYDEDLDLLVHRTITGSTVYTLDARLRLTVWRAAYEWSGELFDALDGVEPVMVRVREGSQAEMEIPPPSKSTGAGPKIARAMGLEPVSDERYEQLRQLALDDAQRAIKRYRNVLEEYRKLTDLPAPAFGTV